MIFKIPWNPSHAKTDSMVGDGKAKVVGVNARIECFERNAHL